MKSTTIAGYMTMLIAWSVIGWHAYDVSKNERDPNLYLIFGSMLFVGLGAGLPIQELDLRRFFGLKQGE